MPRILLPLLCALAISTSAQAERATLSTPKPITGQTLTIHYHAADGILASADSIAIQVLLYHHNADLELHQAPMQQTGTDWQVEVPLKAAVYGLFRFVANDIADTRAGAFWDFIVHDQTGQPVQGAYQALAESWVHPARGPLFGRAENYDQARIAIAREETLYSATDDTRDLRWAVELESGTPNPDALAEITAWLADTAADFDGDSGAFWQRRQRYQQAGLDNELAAFEASLLAKDPRGELAAAVYFERIYDAEEKSLERTERTRTFLAMDFPNLDPFRIEWAIAHLIEGSALDEAAARLTDQPGHFPYQVYELANALITDQQAQRAADLLNGEITAWQEPHPDVRARFASDEDFAARRQWELPRLYEAYGLALLSLGEQHQALAACRQAYELDEGGSANNNGRYVECLVAAGEYEQAVAITRASIESLQYSDSLLEFGREAFRHSGADDDEFERIVARAKAKVERLDLQTPDFVMQSFAGEPIRLSNLRGKVVVLDFWATWCSPCKAAFPYVQKVYERYQHRSDFALYAVNTREALQGEKLRRKVDAFMQKHNYTFPVALDTSKAVYNQFLITGIPTQLFFDQHGVLQFREIGFHGPSTEHTMAARIDLLLEDMLATTDH